MVEKLQRQTSLKSQFFKESSCSLCSVQFGVVDCTYTKKYCCKSCYKAICSSCSGLPVDLSTSKTFDLICKPCHSSSPISTESQKISDLYSSCLSQLKQLNSTKEKIAKTKSKTQAYQKQLTNREIQDPNFEILNKKEELLLRVQELKDQINSICQQIEEKDTIYFEAETFLMDEKNKLDLSKKKTIELYKTLALKQDENIQLVKTLDKLEMPNKSKKKRSDSQIVREVNLRKAYEKLLETEKFFSEKNAQLVEEMKMLERGVEEKSQELEKIEEGIKEAEIEDKFLKELNETLLEQQQLIVKLKSELESSKGEKVNDRKCGVF